MRPGGRQQPLVADDVIAEAEGSIHQRRASTDVRANDHEH
jgi:hypothetical protein